MGVKLFTSADLFYMKFEFTTKNGQKSGIFEKFPIFVKIEAAVLDSNGRVPDFFQLILKIYIKNDFLTT